MCKTSFGIWCWPSRPHGRRLDAGSLRGRDWTLQCTQSLYRAEVPCYDLGQLGRHSKKSGRNLWTHGLCWTSRKVIVFREGTSLAICGCSQPMSANDYTAVLGPVCMKKKGCPGKEGYPPSWRRASVFARKKLTPLPEPIALAHALVVSPWPSWPSWVSQSVYMEHPA